MKSVWLNFVELLLRGGDHARVGMADVEAADAAREIDEGVAVDVGERYAVSLGDHDPKVDRKRLGDHLLLAVEDLPRAGPGNVGADVDRARDGHLVCRPADAVMLRRAKIAAGQGRRERS